MWMGCGDRRTRQLRRPVSACLTTPHRLRDCRHDCVGTLLPDSAQTTPKVLGLSGQCDPRNAPRDRAPAPRLLEGTLLLTVPVAAHSLHDRGPPCSYCVPRSSSRGPGPRRQAGSETNSLDGASAGPDRRRRQPLPEVSPIGAGTIAAVRHLPGATGAGTPVVIRVGCVLRFGRDQGDLCAVRLVCAAVPRRCAGLQRRRGSKCCREAWSNPPLRECDLGRRLASLPTFLARLT